MEQAGLSCGFGILPPEMVTAILEVLGDSPDSDLLACRLVCSQFKLLIDEILEKKQLTLWNWSRSYGESKPTTTPGPIRRPSPAGKVFQAPTDIDKFLSEMKDHSENGLNPFPSGGIYIRRVRSNLLNPPPVALEGQDGEDDRENVPNIQQMLFFGSANVNLLPISKIVELLQVFGMHLNWLIFECGVTTDLASVKELGMILEQVPNIEFLMLKGIRIEKKKKILPSQPQEEPKPEEQLPKLEYLKSIKIIQCHGITQAILHSYHNQVETLQLLNNRDYWFPHFSNLQRTNNGSIFGKLRELKLGEFENSAEFDYFTTFLHSPDYQQPFQKLERLSIHYAIIHDFAKPIAKLFQMLEYLPKLRELNVGQCSETTLVIDVEEERAPIKFTCASSQLASISVPVQLHRYPLLLGKVVKNTPTLQKIKFLESEYGNALDLADAMQAILPEFLTMEGFHKVSKMSVVTFRGGNEQVVCTASK